ncbi:MAG: hypothetical protein Q8873_04860 [Bacillota bacterium]|nr:hypothetical protein [Bacillota bacterium]
MKNMIKRTARTFFQAALGYFAANVVGMINGWDMQKSSLERILLGLVVAAVAAGIAAVMNMPNSKGGKP